MFISEMTGDFLAKADILARMSLNEVMTAATGRVDWKPWELAVYNAEHGHESGGLVPLQVRVEALHDALKPTRYHVPEDDHHYRRRYGKDGGDREYWERLLKNNPAQVLPMLSVRRYENGALIVEDLALDATYVGAMIRDNAWPWTTIMVPTEQYRRFSETWGVSTVELHSPLKRDFFEEFEEVILAMLDMVRPGTVIGPAVKYNDGPGLRRNRPSSYWTLLGGKMTTEDLLLRNFLPAQQLAVQVHYMTVGQFFRESWRSKKLAIPEEVLQTYLNNRGGFAFY